MTECKVYNPPHTAAGSQTLSTTMVRRLVILPVFNKMLEAERTGLAAMGVTYL